MLREDNEDNEISKDFNFDNLYKLFIKNTYENKLDLIICEFHPDEYNDTNKYINNMVLILYQVSRGIILGKSLNNIF